MPERAFRQLHRLTLAQSEAFSCLINKIMLLYRAIPLAERSNSSLKECELNEDGIP